MFKKSVFLLMAILLLLLGACAPAVQIAPTPTIALVATPTLAQTVKPISTPVVTTAPIEEEPYAKYIFFFIGDGMGVNYKRLSQSFLQYTTGKDNAKLMLDSMNVNASVTTYSANASITDSAASGTALSSGVKTNNSMIGIAPDGSNTTTLLEAVQTLGYATGVISTTKITHATPAAFYAHNALRGNGSMIALDLYGSDIDFIAGGGLKFFLPLTLIEPYVSLEPDARGFEIVSTREDEENLMDKFADKGYEIFFGPTGSAELLAYSPSAGDKIFAPLTYNYFPYEIDRLNRFGAVPSLAELTNKAIDLLMLDEQGFFLLVEGARIDYAGHSGDALSAIYETLAFDDAVSAAVNFYSAHPENTLIITTSDHETGGLTLKDDIDYSTRFDSVYDVNASYGDGYALLYSPKITFDEYIAAITSMGILNLTESELRKLKTAFRADAKEEYKEDFNDTLSSRALMDIINARIGVSWSTNYHTAQNVDLGVTGIFEDRFALAADNTDIAKILADILQVHIGT